ncbi:MAG TPA: ABC transporter ATP-binding protein [Acidimicrobiales bacterium]|nr:ABC transporter ATP-binding protein [Acidimicrobiales bacterium]
MGHGVRIILDSLSISFPGRRATCVVGPGGTGKSTLLGTLANEGRVAPPLWARGAVTIEGTVAACPQARPAPPTLADLLAATLPGRATRDCVDAAWWAVPTARDRLLRVAGASLDRLPSDVRRLAEITPVLASGADLLLLDEPDAGARAVTLDWTITQLVHTKADQTVVVATHHLGLAREVADDVLLLLDGTVVEHAGVETFFERPASARTAAFVVMGS